MSKNDTPRPYDIDRYRDNYDKIFRNDEPDSELDRKFKKAYPKAFQVFKDAAASLKGRVLTVVCPPKEKK